jgi:uncharacterized membrane protein YeiH
MNIIEIAEIIGIISFSLSGFLIAIESKLDLLGIMISAFLTALGGGIIRDVIVGRELYAFHDNIASFLVILVVLTSLLIKLKDCRCIETNPFFIVADTFGLVSFAISGALIAQEAGLNITGVVLLSLITATGGGVLRDVLINKIPMILDSEFYGTVALFVGILVYILAKLEMIGVTSIVIIFIIGTILRFVAIYKKWHLPKII